MADDFTLETQLADAAANNFAGTIERVQIRTSALGVSTSAFANDMTKAFTDATVGGKQFDDVLKSMGLRLSSLAVTQAFKPIASGITRTFSKLLSDLFGPDLFPKGGGGRGPGSGSEGNGCCCQQPGAGGCFGAGTPPIIPTIFGTVFPFAAGGVIGAPTYFPLPSGGLGLAGEAGPEAIMPLSRGADGRLGIAMRDGPGGARQAANITVQIATPDVASFRRSEAYITGQIARAVARGQRSL
jgi:phage-related minor tail protein